MFNHHTPGELVLPTRRKFLQQLGHGFGSLALATLLNEQSRAATTAGAVNPLLARPRLSPRAPRPSSGFS